jgi:hypothetical protein
VTIKDFTITTKGSSDKEVVEEDNIEDNKEDNNKIGEVDKEDKEIKEKEE